MPTASSPVGPQSEHRGCSVLASPSRRDSALTQDCSVCQAGVPSAAPPREVTQLLQNCRMGPSEDRDHACLFTSVSPSLAHIRPKRNTRGAGHRDPRIPSSKVREAPPTTLWLSHPQPPLQTPTWPTHSIAPDTAALPLMTPICPPSSREALQGRS